MEDTFTDDFEDNLCPWDNDDSGLSPAIVQDCEYDTEEITEEELYERIYYENDTENRDGKPSFTVSIASSVSRSSISNIDNDDNNNESVRKNCRQDYEVEELNGKKRKEKNNSSVNIGDDFSMKEIQSKQSNNKVMQKKSSKKDAKLSYREIISAAGLTISDLKNFINEGNNGGCISVDHSSDSEASEYLILSETEMSDESDTTFSFEDESVQTLFTSKSLSDSLLAQILNDLPADSSWDISDSDAIGRPKVSSRFYNSLMRVRCHNCSNRGHHQKDCPEPKKQLKCILCGDSGHLFRTCPDQICFRCDQPGHTMRECDEKVASRKTRCARCQSRGHFEERCPDVWRQYHLTVTAGEIIKKNVKDKREVEKNGRRQTCYNCGKDGHLGHKCEKQRMDLYQIVHSPFVFKYDKINSMSDTESCKPLKNGHSRSFNRSGNHYLSTSAPCLRLSHSFKDDHRQHMSYVKDEDIDFSLNYFDDLIPKYKSTPNSYKISRDSSFGDKNASDRMLQSPYNNATGNEKDNIVPLMNLSFDPDVLAGDHKYDHLYRFKIPEVPKRMKKERRIQRGGGLTNMSMPDLSVDRFQHDFQFIQDKDFRSFENFPTKNSCLLDDKEAADSQMSRSSGKREDLLKRRKVLEKKKSKRKMLRLRKEEKFMEKVLKDYNDGKVENGQSLEEYHYKMLLEKRKHLKARRNAEKKKKSKLTDNTENILNEPPIPNMGDNSYGFDSYSDVSKISKNAKKRANERKRKRNSLKMPQNAQVRNNNNITLYENWNESIAPSSNPRTVDFSYENFTVTFT